MGRVAPEASLLTQCRDLPERRPPLASVPRGRSFLLGVKRLLLSESGETSVSGGRPAPPDVRDDSAARNRGALALRQRRPAPCPRRPGRPPAGDIFSFF